MNTKVVGTLAGAGTALAAAGPVGWAILAVAGVAVATVAYSSGQAKGQGDREKQLKTIDMLEKRLRHVEKEIKHTKRMATATIQRLLAERNALRAEIAQRKWAL